MPEIGEVARIVARLNTHLVGKTISAVQATADAIVYKDTTADAFGAAIKGRQVLAAKQWGKYFWLVMDQPPHPLMHFGMAGWVHIKDDPLGHYRAAETPVDTTWPPKHSKFVLQLQDSANEIAFADTRRLGRIRLIDHDGESLRQVSPLRENGPDPVLDPVSLEWLQKQMLTRKVPVKAYLLDQTALAGIGNWVGDEILYHARIHPEAYTNTLSEEQVKDLHKALGYVTKLAVETEAESSKFPDNWLMLHRWGKGKKKGKDGETGNKLPTGEAIAFVTVGGRTSAYVPSLQTHSGTTTLDGGSKKTKRGKKAAAVEDENDKKVEEKTEEKAEKTEEKAKKAEEKEEAKPATKVRKGKKQENGTNKKKATTSGKPASRGQKRKSDDDNSDAKAANNEGETKAEEPKAKKKRTEPSAGRKQAKTVVEPDTSGLRRSSRRKPAV